MLKHVSHNLMVFQLFDMSNKAPLSALSSHIRNLRKCLFCLSVGFLVFVLLDSSFNPHSFLRGIPTPKSSRGHGSTATFFPCKADGELCATPLKAQTPARRRTLCRTGWLGGSRRVRGSLGCQNTRASLFRNLQKTTLIIANFCPSLLNSDLKPLFFFSCCAISISVFI